MTHRSSLRAKVLTVFLLVALVPLLVVGAVTIGSATRSLREQTHDRLERSASVAAAGLDDWVHGQREAVARASRLDAFPEFLTAIGTGEAGDAEQQAEQEALRVLELLRGASGSSSVSFRLLDSSGTVVLDTERRHLGDDWADRDYFRSPMRSDSAYVSTVRTEPASEEATITFAAPIRTGDRADPLGVLVETHGAGALQEIVDAYDGLAGGGSHAVLVDDHGIRLADGEFPDLLFVPVAPLDLATEFKMLDTGRYRGPPTGEPLGISFGQGEMPTGPTESLILTSSTTNGSSYAVAARTVQELPWTVLFTQPERVALGPVDDASRNALVVVALVVGVVAAAGWLTSRRLTRPLRHLEKAATSVADGELDTEVPVESTDEVGQLATTFNRMTAALLHRDRLLRESEERFRTGFETSPVGLALFSVDGTISHVNRSLAAMLGVRRAEIVGKSIQDLLVADDWRRVTCAIPSTHGYGSKAFQTEVRLRPRDGSTRWGRLSLTSLHGHDVEDPDVEHLVLFAQIDDITNQKRLEHHLAHRATHDPLTGLANRGLLLDRIEHSLARSRRTGSITALLFLDLDDMKSVNDRYGHAVGDELIKAVGARLVAGVRESDTVARFGGDEFVICCEEMLDLGTLRDVIGRVRACLREPLHLSIGPTVVTASAGAAHSRGRDATADTLVREADAAMYRAKQAGKNHTEVFDESMRKAAAERRVAIQELRRALEEEQFELVYQTQVRLHDARLTGLEALIRWGHPERGTVAPADFIPLAEDSGLIDRLGSWVIGRACEQMSEWRQRFDSAHDLTVFVNVSPLQLYGTHLDAVVRATLCRSGLDPSALGLEMTESAFEGEIGRVAGMLEAISASGVRLAIDDFGIGYSSLAHLKRFPVDILKIDRSFVAGMGRNTGDTALVKTILELARSLDLEVVAEGVETPVQAMWLEDLGCGYAQGFHFGRPQPAGTITELLQGLDRDRQDTEPEDAFHADWAHRSDHPEPTHASPPRPPRP